MRLPILAIVRAGAIGVLIGLIVVQPVYATHFVPGPRWWWDLDDDRVIDEADSNIGYGAAGGGWDAEKHDDVFDVTADWRGGTRWDPFDASGGAGTIRGTIRVQGKPPCVEEWPQAWFAMNCIQAAPRHDGPFIDFYDISDSDIGINKVHHNWNFGSDDTQFIILDFRGVLTHELGHGARLEHVNNIANCGNPVYSMCGDPPAQNYGTFSQEFRDITNHDINAANTVYPV